MRPLGAAAGAGLRICADPCARRGFASVASVPPRKANRSAKPHRRAQDEHATRLLPRRRPLQARARERVERILEVTASLLAGPAADTLSTAEIARRAGVPIGSVYHYFPSKEAILAELAGRKFLEVDATSARRLGKDLARMDWRRALERSIDAGVTAFRSDPVYLRLWRITRSSPAFRSVAAASDERFARSLELLPPFQELAPARRRLVVRAAIRTANAFLDWILETDDPRQVPAMVREMKRALVTYLDSALGQA